MATVRNFDLIPDNSKKKMIHYLQRFYDILKEPKHRAYGILKQRKQRQ